MSQSPLNIGMVSKRSHLWRYLHIGATLSLLPLAVLVAILVTLGRVEIRFPDAPGSIDDSPQDQTGASKAGGAFIMPDEELGRSLALLHYLGVGFRYDSDNYLACWLEVEHRFGSEKQVEKYPFGTMTLEPADDKTKPKQDDVGPSEVLQSKKGRFALVVLGPRSEKDLQEKEWASWCRFVTDSDYSQIRLKQVLIPYPGEHKSASKIYTHPHAPVDTELLLWRYTVTVGDQNNAHETVLLLKARFLTE
jgi:hypothetical protein